MSILKIGIPSKGRLQDDTVDWFASRGLTLKRTGSAREYSGAFEGLPDVEPVLLSAGEIPKELAAGHIHLGVTGTDLIHEKLPLRETQVQMMAEMGFGFADLIIAVPKFWIDVSTIDDLDAVAAEFRSTHRFRLRIATKYHNVVRDYLKRVGVADYQLVDSQGATEGTIRNLTAEAIADITTTGATLEANHLKTLRDEPLLKSQACLWKSLTADWDNVPGWAGFAAKLGWDAS
ncbi:MAG: ATP phosphoribosyltransferase [Pseudomonadota bacterium]